MPWAVESVAKGPLGAVKIIVRFDHAPADFDVANVRVEASGMYRRFYRDWCEDTPTSTTKEIP